MRMTMAGLRQSGTTACMRRKREGLTASAFIRQEMQVQVAERAALEKALHSAVSQTMSST